MLDRLKLPSTPLSIAFRSIEPSWRAYLEYADYAARSGDEDMQKLLEVYRALPPLEQRAATPEQLCDLAQIGPGSLVGAVSREYWVHKQRESAITASTRHPKLIEATANFGQKYLSANRDRELFFRVTGGVPDKKVASIVINNHPQAMASASAASIGAGSFIPMDQNVIEMGELLDSPAPESAVPFLEESAFVVQPASHPPKD